MPLAISWVEELVSEYFMLRSYVVTTDYPTGTGRKGGRRDIDIVAVNPAEKVIYLIEVKDAWSAPPSVTAKKIEKKLNEAEKVFERIYGSNYKYVKMAIIIGVSSRPATNNLIKELESMGIKAQTLGSLIKEIVDYVCKWRKQLINRGIVHSNTTPACPGNLYLIKLLEFLNDDGLLKIEQT